MFMTANVCDAMEGLSAQALKMYCNPM